MTEDNPNNIIDIIFKDFTQKTVKERRKISMRIIRRLSPVIIKVLAEELKPDITLFARAAQELIASNTAPEKEEVPVQP